MQAIVFPAPEQIALEQVPDPRCAPDEVVVQVAQSGICGTDVHLWKGQLPIALPLIMGHETVGRIERLGDGREIVWSVQQMLDEIDDADIVRLSDGARAVAERAIARRSDIALAQWERDHATIGYLPTWARKLPRSMTVLRTPAELVAEGRDLHHCVGGYVEAVRRGQCVILAVRSRHGRSTVEMSTDGLTVRQHYGAYNGAPPARHAALLRAWHLRITTTTEYRRSA